MISISDYCDSRQVSKPTVYRQLKRYAAELSGHIVTENGIRCLDAEAVRFLDQHRMSRTVVQEYADGQAKHEIERLKSELDVLKNEKLKDQQKIISLLEQNNHLMEHKAENKLLLEQNSRDRQQLEAIQDSLTETQSKVQELEQEVSSFKKSLFGFYRKR